MIENLHLAILAQLIQPFMYIFAPLLMVHIFKKLIVD